MWLLSKKKLRQKTEPGPGNPFMSDRRAEGRRAGFKFHGMTTEELRRRREVNQVEIRKAKREDSLNKRRNLVEVGTPTPESFSDHTSNLPMNDSEVKTALFFNLVLNVCLDVSEAFKHVPRTLFS